MHRPRRRRARRHPRAAVAPRAGTRGDRRTDGRMTVFVYAEGALSAHEDAEHAVNAALDLATHHSRVGIGCTKAAAMGAAARALPGMVVCPRGEAFDCAECYPLTATMSLVKPCSGRSVRSPDARSLRSITSRATPLAPTVS